MAITVTFEQVLSAKTDVCEQEKIYWAVFYDSQCSPKLRKWLVKKGVPHQHLEDLESEMRLALFRAIHRYNHGKIPFEKYIWTEFHQILVNWFVSHGRRSGKALSIDEMVEVHGDSIELNLGNVSLDGGDAGMDVEEVFSRMTQRQGMIARCLYYNDWSHADVRQYLGLSPQQYSRELQAVRKVVTDYLAQR